MEESAAAMREADRDRAAAAIDNFSRDELDRLLSVRELMESRVVGRALEAMTDVIRARDNWKTLTDRLHMEECQDPDCEAIVCRAQRGLPPLTSEAIAAEQEAERERRQQLQERSTEYLRGRL